MCIRSCVPLPHLRPDSCTYTRQAASAVRAVTRIACADRALACGNACPHRRGSSARALLGACEAYAMRVTLYQLSPRLSRKTQACTCTRQATSAVLSEHKHCMYRSRARPARECIPQRHGSSARALRARPMRGRARISRGRSPFLLRSPMPLALLDPDSSSSLWPLPRSCWSSPDQAVRCVPRSTGSAERHTPTPVGFSAPLPLPAYSAREVFLLVKILFISAVSEAL